MPRPLPQFDQSFPIVQSQGVASAAPGEQAIAETAGGFADLLFHKAQSMQKEESSINYLQGRDQIDQELNKAKIDMIKNPGRAGMIAKQTENSLKIIGQNTALNKMNREQMEYDIHHSIGSVKLEAAQQQVQQNRLMGQFKFLSTLPQTMKAYQTALMTDPKQAEAIHENLINALPGLVASRIITPHEAAAASKGMQAVTDAVHNMYKLSKNADANAADLNAAHASLLSPDTINNANLPINQDTAEIFNDSIEDHTAQRAFSEAMIGIKPPPDVWLGLKAKSMQKMMLYLHGASQADGLINSSAPFTQILDRIQELDAKPSRTFPEKAEKAKLDYFVKRLKNNEYLSVAAETPAGSAIVREFHSAERAIQAAYSDDKGYLSPEGHQLLSDKYNDFVTKMIKVGEASHLPEKFINPFPASKVAQVESGFEQGGNPNNALAEMDVLRKDLRPYLAFQVKDKVHQQALLSYGYTDPNDANKPFYEKLIHYSQPGIDKKALQLGKEGTSEVNTRLAVLPYIKDFINYKARQPLAGNMNFGDQVEGFAKLAMNWAQGEALRNGDFELKDINKYMNEFKREMAKSYPILQGSNFAINQKDINIDPKEAAAVAYYLQQKAMKRTGHTEQDNEINPLFVTASPGKKFYVYDSHGNLFDHPEDYDTNLVHAAENLFKKEINEAQYKSHIVSAALFGAGP